MSYYEDYTTFKNRIYSFEKPEFCFGMESLVPSESVKGKVNTDGTFCRFIGDTVVFNLQDSQKELIKSQYIDPLYGIAGDCFAWKFSKQTIHMTLHDLNAMNYNSYEIMEKMFETEIVLAEKLKGNKYNVENIDMETTCVFNMVNTSLVLGLIPKSKTDYDKLMQLYMLVDSIKPLPYQFTPHITLAYYRRDEVNREKLDGIEKMINYLNKFHFDISLSTQHLYYQKFTDMNSFFDIMPFVK